ncbi:hypothetical protein HFM15_001642 [Vibrio cholerae]|nr:hypothetical protein [Vibrio cholerae]
MATVNTQAESLPMVMYPRYCVPRLNKYAKEIGINLIHSMITPSFYDEYANRYLGAQKLIPNASRSGDCSVILKVDPAKEFIKSVRSRLLNSESLKPYHSSTIICVTGQRSSESARRMSNMNSQGVSAKDLNQLKAELTELSISGLSKTLNFAPIRDWTTDEVFLAHELAGIKPLTRNLLGIYNAIPSFLPDHALMLSIYGNASTEQCEISIGSTASNGCNGKARYGCGICTMIGEKDKTQSSLTLHERWNYLGQKELLAIRDYMYRLSIDITQRAFHAKAIDQVAYNRIALQANILKPEALESLVRLFSQISILSAERAAEFRDFVESGRAEQHPAVQEIASDKSLNAKARRAFQEMYIEEAQKPLIELFSEKHAIYLSFRWSLDGIQAYPFTPLAIWNECITNKKNWIEWPSFNSEIDTPKKSLNDPTNKLPDAVMMPVLQSKFENPSVYIENDELHDIGNFISTSIEKLMQRTALFTEIGAFNYQSMSYEDLIQMPWAISMKQHRSDKAKVLLELRRKFHHQNEEIRTQLRLNNLPAYSALKAIDKHISNARYAVVTYIDSTLSKAFKSQFTTSNVSLSQKSKSSLLWIIYHQALMNVDDYITYVTPFRSTIRDDSECYLVLGKHIKNSICELRTQIDDAWRKWGKLIDRFEILNLEVSQTLVDSQTAGADTSNRIKDEILARYKQAITDLHPNISNELFEADASFWKPNTKTLIHEFALMSQAINYCRTIVNNYLDTLLLVEASAGYSQFKKIELNKQFELSQSIPVIVDSIIKPSSHCLIEVDRTLPVDKHDAKPKRPKNDRRKVDHFSLLMGI